ncbi:MAG: VCBS repeat-containing protein [Planctomycetota bacterium]
MSFSETRRPSRHAWRQCGRALGAGAFSLAFAAGLLGQEQFAAPVNAHYPAQGGVALASTDADGDGDVDLLLAQTGPNTLLVGNGDGMFIDASAAQLPLNIDRSQAVATGDVDGDGDADVVVANTLYFFYGAANRLYLNDGAGMFTEAPGAFADSDVSIALALADFDGDTDLDLIVGNGWGQPNRLFQNDGTGVFSDVTATNLPADTDNTHAVAPCDVDGDGDLDLLLGNGLQDRLYLNDGTGLFTDATATNFPTTVDATRDLAIGDVDGDGDCDVALATLSIDPVIQNRLYLNDGAGVFTDATSQLPFDTDQTEGVAIGDVDGDTDLDLLWANAGSQNRLYLNDGTGIFTDATTQVPSDTAVSQDVLLVDVDGDMDIDAVFGGGLYINDGTGQFVDTLPRPLPALLDGTCRFALGDVDADGDNDLVLARCLNGGQPNGLYLNDGFGSFADSSPAQWPSAQDATSGVAAGDFDGDGDLDFAFANAGTGTGEQNRLVINDGAGAFTDVTATQLPVEIDTSVSVDAGDVDGDGDLDLWFSNGNSSGEQDRLYLNNDGTGLFTDATAVKLPVIAHNSFWVFLRDVDGDSDVDALVGDPAPHLYLNDGTGAFTDVTASQLPVVAATTVGAAVGDVDGDGDVDLVMSGPTTLLSNDGAGVFTDVTATNLPAGVTASEVIMVDVDDDADLDLVLGTQLGSSDLLLENDGTGLFSDVSSRLPANASLTTSFAAADLDSDGDLDLVAATSDGERIYTNLARQLATPLLTRPGRPWRLDAYARFLTPAADFALPIVGGAATSIPLPGIGTFGLNPIGLIVLPPFFVQPEGFGSLALDLPDEPTFVGLEIFAQALLVQSNGDLSLTQVTRDVFLP